MAKKKNNSTAANDSTTTKIEAASEPKILVIDIETAPLHVLAWRLGEDFINLDQVQEEWTILSYCAKWVGKKGLMYRDVGGNGPDAVRNDVLLLHDLWSLLDSADIVVAQNGKRFDIKKINARLIINGFGPYSPVRIVDTLSVSRKYFGFTSNKLAWTSQYLTDARKLDHRKYPGLELWVECLKDNPDAWSEMAKYNKRDVVACEQLYLRLRPWISDHPNLGAYKQQSRHICSKCGSAKMQARGYTVLQSGRYQRYHCQACGGWSRGKENLLDTDKRKTILV